MLEEADEKKIEFKWDMKSIYLQTIENTSMKYKSLKQKLQD
jgi:hypothetical protein